jgi:glycosyltransferase involved in cell wall biosynthesis
MKIAFNLWSLKRLDQREGIGSFIMYTLPFIIASNPEVRFVFYTATDFDEKEFAATHVVIKKIFPPKRHPFLYLTYLNLVLPLFLKKDKPDLFVSLDGMLSLWSGVPQMAVMYDINFVHFSDQLAWYNRWYYNRYYPKYAKKAVRIATISEYSKRDIVKQFNIPEYRIDVVYCGLNSYFLEEGRGSVEQNDPGLKPAPPYFFYIGSINPRKNISGLIAAFEAFRKTGRDARLVIAGSKGWLNDEVDSAYRQSAWKQDIIFTGRIDNSAVKPLMSGALALTFVSYFEGFGIPLIEAMKCRIPIITSGVTSLPEVAGDAALYIDPYDTSSITGAMTRIYDEPVLRQQLIEKGDKRCRLFEWERTARLLWGSILEAMPRAK